jgi:hypothetical protein
MLRARWAAVILAGSLSLVSGCMHYDCPGPLGGPFGSVFGSPHCDCACGSTMVGRLDHSAVTVGPETVYPATPTTNPGMPMPSFTPPSAQPKIYPVPQAPAVPYTP